MAMGEEQTTGKGIVSKRLTSPYREGKHHKDWLKKKTKQQFDDKHHRINLQGWSIPYPA